jgi:hypothetical protein
MEEGPIGVSYVSSKRPKRINTSVGQPAPLAVPELPPTPPVSFPIVRLISHAAISGSLLQYVPFMPYKASTILCNCTWEPNSAQLKRRDAGLYGLLALWIDGVTSLDLQMTDPQSRSPGAVQTVLRDLDVSRKAVPFSTSLWISSEDTVLTFKVNTATAMPMRFMMVLLVKYNM